MSLEYHILGIDDDPIVLDEIDMMYQEMIEFGDFEPIFGEDSRGSVSVVSSTDDGEAILSDNFERNPKLIEILHLDQRMPNETGAEFSDRMRWKYAGRRLGSLLVTGYATDVSVQNSREKGVYRYLSKPVTPEIILPHLSDLVSVVFSREKPIKREIVDQFIFKQINKPEQLKDYFELRYNVFNFMNYLQQSNERRLDIDKFDSYSIPFGGFIINGDGKEKIVALSRLVTNKIQPKYETMINQLLEYDIPINLVDTKIDKNVKTIGDFISIPKSGDFPVAESFPIQHLLEQYEQNGLDWGEYSRIIVHPDYRGFGLSKMIILTSLAGNYIKGGPEMIFGACVPQHVPMYEKYGWRCIEDLDLVLEEKVQQPAKAMVANVFNEIPEKYSKQLKHYIVPQLENKNEVYYPFR